MTLCNVCLGPLHVDETPVHSPHSSSQDCNTCRTEANEIGSDSLGDLLDIDDIFGADPGDSPEDSER
jgi:hypothetical protein